MARHLGRKPVERPLEGRDGFLGRQIAVATHHRGINPDGDGVAHRRGPDTRCHDASWPHIEERYSDLPAHSRFSAATSEVPSLDRPLFSSLLLLLFFWSLSRTRMVDRSHNRLTAVTDIHISYDHLLADFSTVTVQSLHLRGEGAQQFVSAVYIRIDHFGGLPLDSGSCQARHREAVYSNHLRREQSLNCIFRADTVKSSKHVIGIAWISGETTRQRGANLKEEFRH
jgi:hypothetical protein